LFLVLGVAIGGVALREGAVVSCVRVPLCCRFPVRKDDSDSLANSRRKDASGRARGGLMRKREPFGGCTEPSHIDGGNSTAQETTRLFRNNPFPWNF
jgi:hypothetical protein